MAKPSEFKQRAVLLDSAPLSPGVRKLTWRTQEGTPLQWEPGQYIQLRLPARRDLVLPYSIASAVDPRQPGVFELAVSVSSEGELLNSLQAGEVAELDGPHGTFFRSAEERGPALLIGAGTGVAPLRAMIQGLSPDSGDELSPVVLLLGARGEGDLLFADEFMQIERTCRYFAYVPTLSAPETNWQGRRGYVQSHIAALLPRFTGGTFLGSAKAYVCGGTAMVQATVRELLRVGFAEQNVLSESH